MNCNQNCNHALAALPPASEQRTELNLAALHSFSAADVTITDHRGESAGFLGQLGYQQTLLIEVPAPDPHDQPELAQAVALLAQAQANLQRGHDRDAVGALRDVLELTLALGDDDNRDPEITRVLFGNSRSMTKVDRLRVLRRAHAKLAA